MKGEIADCTEEFVKVWLFLTKHQDCQFYSIHQVKMLNLGTPERLTAVDYTRLKK